MNSGVPSHFIQIKTVSQAAESLWLQITAPPGTLPALMKKCTPGIRHSDNARQPLFQIATGADEDMAPQTQHVCPVLNCRTTLTDANHAVNHASYHQVVTPSLRNSETCALCLGPASACPSFLVKTTTLQPRLFCVFFHGVPQSTMLQVE